MPAVGRNAFTSDEDKLLVKYLAKYNPGVKGRSGNRVYKALVENEHNKWSWGSTHPWSGWRDRYTRNQPWFDRRIKKYQKEHDLPTENPTWINGTQKPKGSDVEDEVIPESSTLKRKRASSAEARKRAKVVRQRVEDSDSEVNEASATAAEPAPSTRRRTHVPDIYPDIAVLDVSVSPQSEPPKPKPKPQPPSARPAPKPKPALALKRPPTHDSDFFASVPPTPTTVSRPPTTASGSRASVTSNTSVHDQRAEPSPKPASSRGLPRLVEGAFRSFFAGVGQWGGSGGKGSDDDASPQKKKAPPPRVRREEKAGDDAEMEMEGRSEGTRTTKEGAAPRRNRVSDKAGDDLDMDVEEHSLKEKEKALRARRPPQQVNAVASSSRAQLPASSSRAQLPPSTSESRSRRTPSTPQLQTKHTRTPRSPPRSSRPRSPPRSDSPHSHRSPSPLDWGSPVGPEGVEARGRSGSPIDASSSPVKPRSISISSPQRPAPHDRRWYDVGSSSVLPPLSLTDLGSNRGGNRNRSIGSVDVEREREQDGSVPRRSRAPSPRRTHTQYQYHLPSPVPLHAGSSRPQSGTPLEKKTKRRARDQDPLLPFIFKPTVPAQHPADDARRHSFPAALPHIDFNRMRMNGGSSPTRPRQSLPPRAPPRQYPAPLTRRRSLFSPRTPAATAATASMSVSPAQISVSPEDRDLYQAGLRAMVKMSKNHGFGLEVVRNVCARTEGDLEQTDAILLRMRRGAEAAAEAALREAEAAPPEPEPLFELSHSHRPRSIAIRSPPDPNPETPEQPFELRHRRQHSGATAATARSSSQRKKQQRREEEFRPQPLARDNVLADTEYTPPSGSRAGAFARMQRKGRVEEGLQREQERASGGGTVSAFSRHARMQTQGRIAHMDMEDDVPPTPQFTAFAGGDEEVCRAVEKKDVSLAMLRTADVARYMAHGTIPSPYR